MSGLTVKSINALTGVDDAWKAPARLMATLLDKPRREDMFRRFQELDNDLSTDWFQGYFEEEQAERKSKGQDFTPPSVAVLLNRLVGHDGRSALDVAAGTGGIVVKRWSEDRLNNVDYQPSQYWYEAEELSDRAVPFLIFNMAIRGMNGVIRHGDSLKRAWKDVFILRNTHDDFPHFSDVEVASHASG